MDRTWQDVMKAAISEVLETMYFTDVVFQPKAPAGPLDGWEATIDVRPVTPGPTARVILRFVETFAQELAANMLGLDPEKIQRDDVQDAMQELANMVAGSCVVLLGPERWKIGLPSARPALWSAGDSGGGFGMLSSGAFVGWASCRNV